MTPLTGTELNRLRRRSQRFRLYFASWGTWQITQSVPLLTDPVTGEPRGSILIHPSDWRPVLNIGANRLGFVGEPLTFDATRSWTRGGGEVSGGSWMFEGGDPETATDVGPHEVLWATPGLYTVTYTNGDAQTRRMVRIYPSRDHVPYDVVAVDGVTGDVTGGWRATVTIQPNAHRTEPIMINDFQMVGLFCEESWLTSNGWDRRPIGGYLPDPRLVLSGFVEQGSVRTDANTNAVTFTLGSLQTQLAACTIPTVHVWNEMVPSELGAIVLKGLPKMTMVDVALQLLMFFTNVLEAHDVVAWYDASQQNLYQVSGNEGDLWSVLTGWMENEFAWTVVDQGNGLRLVPNPHIRSTSAFNSLYPVRMTVTDQDLLAVDVQERKLRNVIWVQVRGINQIASADVTGTAKVEFHAEYPSPTPPSGPGSWKIIQGILVSQQSYVDALAPRIYADANRKYVVTLITALNRAIGVPARIRLTLSIPSQGINWTDKLFIVRQVAYAIDLGQDTWRTSITAEEAI